MKKWDVALTAILVACALVTTGLVVRREFFSAAAAPTLPAAKPVLIDEWRSIRDAGITLDSPDAPVQLIEFADFECPFCASFHKTVQAVQKQYPDKIGVTFVHFPLQGHRFALPAARAAECAGEQGRFKSMHNLLFTQQNAFGLKPWSEFAVEAGVADLEQFESCTQESTALPRVESGQQAGERLQVRGTPTVIINGWQLSQPPSASQLAAMVENILEGKDPT